ncbi:hypothetical protein HN695_06710 [Candidatus Woesearchaeota archaeon]|jgi:uncharacterized membrane protein SpoIIM required for sporulation|nr:hypothetical protein [Candidatus Woesearchaeota archaeon]MBT5271948.1 hypothetical protein [Candidatus Woesearchaeota archaeon]MBT6041060.1 hypothetical protein [Candidatus Woesearchaeota archaeon]MBT6336236.1 hypothetical protein [Candidatus Woesearchaeota archaeon]MBT7927997.1 hypothetical protein [Candidatus Woesearchaeota archaeon]
MVLDVLINPIEAEKRPWQMFFLGVLFSSMAALLGTLIFVKYSSLVMVFLTVLASFPIIYNTIKLEEIKDEHAVSETRLLKEHSKAISAFMFLFLGILVASTLWFVFLPSEQVNHLFSTQLDTITSINTQYTGNVVRPNVLSTIFMNNLRVLSICLLFSFLYGVGAMFILTWNATVIAAAIGTFIRENLASFGNLIGEVSIFKYFHIFSSGFFKYMFHGFFEILAYFVVALAGGIISVAVIRHVFGSKKFERIMFDVSELIIISVLLLFVAALLEVYVTPVLF